MKLLIHRLALATAATICSIAVTGCTLSSNPAGPVTSAVGHIQGRAFGGNQPIVGAQIFVYAAGTGGYGGASTLLSTTVPTTDTNGFFDITADYTCTQGQQVYVYALGGNTGSGTNSGSGMLAVLGTCPASGTLAQVTPYVWMNEVTTAATAYAISGFATDATHVSDDEAVAGNTTYKIAQTGMANAFANAANLVNVATGTALTTMGNSSASGQTAAIVVPQAQINTIADVLAACVNTTSTTDSPSPNCTTLFENATSDGTALGTQPTDTATAAINIAHHPAANIAALYGVIAAQGAAFLPDDSTQPADFSVSILFPQGGSATTGIAIDAYGNVYASYGGGNLVYSITPTGTETLLGVTAPRRLAVDAQNNLWVPTTGTTLASNAGTISMFPASGTSAPVTAPGALNANGGATGNLFTAYNTSGTKQLSVGAVAFDQNDSMWELSTGSVLTANLLPYVTTPAATAATVTIAIPTASSMFAVSPTTGNVAVTSGATTAGALSIYTDTGTVVATGATGAGLYTPTGVISDASGNFWVGNAASSSSSTNTTISVFNGATDATVAGAPYAIAPPAGETTTQLFSGDFDGQGYYYTGGTTYATGTTATNLPAIYQVGPTGTQIAVFVPSTTATGGSDASNQFVGVDPSGNLWFGATKYIGEMIGVAAPKVTPTVVANFPGLIQATPITGINPSTYPNKVATRP